MAWKKIGNIFSCDGNAPWMRSHAAVPFVGKINGSEVEIFFSTRDENNRSSIGGFVFDIELKKTIYVSPTPYLVPGTIDSFDHDGVMGSHITTINETSYLYYTGWNKGVSVPFRNAIGMAVVKENGFEKMFDGPVLDRSIYDPCFVASNCIVRIGETYIMYYLSCIRWVKKQDKLTHYYHIKIATSIDGINWNRSGKVAIDFKYENEYAISVPRVIYEENVY
jgi:hypothetical protein